MRWIVGFRGTGRTSQLLDWVRAAPEGEHRVLVSGEERESMRLLRENPDLESWQFVSFGEVAAPACFSGVLQGRGGRVVLGIDNVDMILGGLFRFPIGAASAEGEATESDFEIEEEPHDY